MGSKSGGSGTMSPSSERWYTVLRLAAAMQW